MPPIPSWRKSFWVCWTLKRLFEMPKKDAPTLIFKGGTSLSKAFGAIRRFSEDIDLSFDRADLGYTGDRDPDQEGISRKQAGKLIEDLVGDVAKHIAEKLLRPPCGDRPTSRRTDKGRMVAADRRERSADRELPLSNRAVQGGV